VLSWNRRGLSFAPPRFLALRFTALNIHATECAKRSGNTVQLIVETRSLLLKLTYERLNK